MRTKAEKKWLLIFSLAVLAVTSIPYVMGFIMQGEDWRYTGFVFGVEDGNSYIAKMLSGAYGAWLFKTPYTAVPQGGFLGFVPYLLLGKISLRNMQHVSLVVLFHAFRWLGGFLMVRATYDFVSVFIEETRYRRWATIVSSIGGGFGWLAILGLSGLWSNGLPLEFYSPESFGFLSIYGLPHLACARAFLLWGIARYLTCRKKDWRGGLKASVLWLGLGLMQPITVVVGGALIGWHLILTGARALYLKNEVLKSRWKEQLGFALMMAIFPAPIVLYTVWAFIIDPFLSGWSGQNIIASPPIWDYVLAYGGMLALAVSGLRRIWQNEEARNRWLFLLGWVAIFPVLAYLPFGVQRRLPEGVWTAISVLAVAGVAALPEKLRRFDKAASVVSVLPACILILGGITAVMHVDTPLYRPAKEAETFDWLRAQGEPGSVVLAGYETSNPLPAWAPMRCLVGHGPESVNLEEVMEQVEIFYSEGSSDEERRVFLEEYHVAYVIWGPEEKALGNWGVASAHYLEPVFMNEEYDVFRVVNEDAK